MATVSVVALLGALAVALLLVLQPWVPTSVTPRAIGLVPTPSGVAGESTQGSPARMLAVAPARPLTGTAKLVSAPASEAPSAPGPEAGIAPARALTYPAGGSPVEVQPQGQAPEAPATPSPPPATSPGAEVVPVAAPAPSPEPAPQSPQSPAEVVGPPAGPITSGSGSIGGSAEPVEVREGGEYALAFSFYVLPTAYRAPGAESSILRLGASGEVPTFGLQLWDDGAGQRGLWSSGEAMGGEHFLAPLGEGAWHRLVAYFVAGAPEEGLYLLILDGRPIDTRAWVNLLPPAGSGQLAVGLQREGEPVPTAPDVLFGPVELGEGPESVLP